MGVFSVNACCNAIAFSLHPHVKHWKALVLIFFLNGEFDNGVLLVDVREQFIFMNPFGDKPSVINIPAPPMPYLQIRP